LTMKRSSFFLHNKYLQHPLRLCLYLSL
jgi:hypothetical protein